MPSETDPNSWSEFGAENTNEKAVTRANCVDTLGIREAGGAESEVEIRFRIQCKCGATNRDDRHNVATDCAEFVAFRQVRKQGSSPVVVKYHFQCCSVATSSDPPKRRHARSLSNPTGSS